MNAWVKTARQLIRVGVTLDNCADLVVKQEVPDILCSALVDDCIARGKRLKEGGAHYDIISQLQMGVADLGSSRAAFKKLVYDEAMLSRDALWNARMTDYAGDDGECIRRSTRIASGAWQAMLAAYGDALNEETFKERLGLIPMKTIMTTTRSATSKSSSSLWEI